MNIILLGAPGAGKGTQAEAIVKKFNLFHVSTGNLFREALSQGNDLGKMAKSYIDRGELVPDDIVLKIVVKNLPENSGYLFDGFPRNVNQAKILDEMLDSEKKKIDAVINLEVQFPQLIERLLSRGRSDDNRVTIENRLKVYEEQTKPLIDYYKKQKKIIDVNGNQNVAQVSHIICTALESCCG